MTVLLFAYDGYYPDGGSHDLVGAFDNLDAVRAALGMLPSKVSGRSYVPPDYAHAYDIEKQTIVASWMSSRATPKEWEKYGVERQVDEGVTVRADERWRWYVEPDA